MRRYVESLEQCGELVVVDREVDPKYELAAVTKKLEDQLNKAVLFTNIRGTQFRVVTNLYGSRDRVASIIQTTASDLNRTWSRLINQPRDRDHRAELLFHETTGSDELISGRLSDLPLITYNERDAGPYFTSAIFLAKEPDSGVPNLSFHRSMFVSDGELRVRLGPTHHLTMFHEKAERRGQPLEAALLIGTQPEVFLAAAASVPYDADEMALAAEFAGHPIGLRPCQFVDLQVPAETEIVVEGRFLPNERRQEGPFGEFMGYYSPVGKNAVFEVLGVTWRPNAIFHSILTGSPEGNLPQEVAVAANMYRRLSEVLPGIVDVNCLPFETHAVVQIHQLYSGHARQVLLAAMGVEPVWGKMCTVVDEDVDIYDLHDVMWAILMRSRLKQDIILVDDIPSYYPDPDQWGRMGIDATVPYDRRAEFERTRIPGIADVDVSKYVSVKRRAAGR